MQEYHRNLAQFGQLRKDDAEEQAAFPMGRPYPRLYDRYAPAGIATGHYFYQDLLVAQRIHRAQPHRHIDVGSRIDGFVAHVASFRAIEVLDIRPLETSNDRIIFHKHNIMVAKSNWDKSCDSLSCLHAIEHFGLGRYGDPLSVRGWRDAWEHLHSMVESGGTIYLSTVIGPQRIEFDAHRVFALPTIIDLTAATCDLASLSYIDDLGEIHLNVDLDNVAIERSFDCVYGCAILELRRH